MGQWKYAVPTALQRYGAQAIARFKAMGWWQDGSLGALLDRWAEEAPTRRAASDGTLEFDYASLRQRAYGLARCLKALGVARGDRVLMQLPNWTESVVTYNAVARMGCILVPAMMVYRHAELAQMLNNSGAVAAIVTGRFRSFDHGAMFRELKKLCPALKHIVMVRTKAQDEEIDFEAACANSDGGDLGPYPDPDDPHIIIYTSGTESTAKGCCHTWNTFNFSGRGVAEKVFELRPADTMFVVSPVGHSTGLMHGILVPMNAGCGIHLLDVWEPGEGLRRIERYGCTAVASATPFVRMALDAAKDGGHDLSAMRTWLCAGAPIPVSLAEEFAAVFRNAMLLPLYGTTEIIVASTSQHSDPMAVRAGTAGRPIFGGVELKRIKEDGALAGPGEEGEILYRGPGGMLGYYADPERSVNAIDAEGWYHTGDLGVADAQAYLRISGRSKDIIIRGGANISAGEVEGYLLGHPRVKSVAVVAYPDETLGERACAVVVATPGEPLSLPELVAFLRARQISPQKLPEKLVVLDELPMTASGKVQKFILRQLLREGSL